MRFNLSLYVILYSVNYLYRTRANGEITLLLDSKPVPIFCHYWSTPFSKICFGMRIDRKLRFAIINKTADSLYSMTADRKYRNTSLGRDTWKSLVGPSASLQLNCNKEGFNADAYDDPVHKVDLSKARIGIISNEQNDCKSCDSRIGFGTGGYPQEDNTCGNVVRHNGNRGNRNTKAMGYILVQ